MTGGSEGVGAAAFQRVIDLNITAPLALTHRFGRLMRERRRGGILLVGSLSSHYGAVRQSILGGDVQSQLAFFSFITLVDAGPAEHEAYNRWHQLDHRPENLALPGVLWGDRWARPVEYRDASTAVAKHEGTDYIAMYWFGEPLDAALRAWNLLATDSFQWGRGPVFPFVRRNLLSFFRPVKGYAAPSALVSPDVLPYRPNRGLHVTLTRHAEPFGAETEAQYRWEDRTLIPALLDLDGVAGVWTFSFSHHQENPLIPAADTSDTPGSLRLQLIYLDEEPLATTTQIEKRRGELDSDPGVGETLLSTPLRTIIPWRDW